jgi:hypothetical protein
MTYLRLCLGGLVLAASGCGLISSDVTNVQISLQPKMFSVDASGWQVNQTAANLYLGMTCDPAQPAPNVCSSAATQACPMGCTGSCDATAHTCDLGLNVGIYKPVDLATESPEIATINSEPIVKVTIDNLTYQVSGNTLNVMTPQMTVFVAPMSVTDPKDPSAKAIGTIDPIPAMTVVAEKSMTYTTGGKQALADTMGNYKVPFNVIVGTTLLVRQGDPVPAGKLDAAVKIAAHAGP